MSLSKELEDVMGDGCNTKIWMDPLILTTKLYRELEQVTVKSLMDDDHKK